jgi:hypothetical protein
MLLLAPAICSSRRVKRVNVGSPPPATGASATQPPLIDYANTVPSAAGQFTLAFFAPTKMGNNVDNVVGTPTYEIYYARIDQVPSNRDEVEKGPAGTATMETDTASPFVKTGLAAGTYAACVVSVLDGVRSFESTVYVFTVT